MSNPPTLTEQDLDRFRTVKQDCVLDMDERGTDDSYPVIEMYRDGELLAVIFVPEVDRDRALEAAYYSIPHLDLDRITMTFDSHFTQVPINPQTGKPWGGGELGRLKEEGEFSDLLSDALVVTDMTRDGDLQAFILPYSVDKDAKRVTWSEFDMDVNQLPLDGYVPDVLREAFTIEPDWPPIPDDSDFGEEEARGAQDAMAIINLTRNGYMVSLAFPEEPTLRSEACKEMLKFAQGLLGDFAMGSPEQFEEGFNRGNN